MGDYACYEHQPGKAPECCADSINGISGIQVQLIHAEQEGPYQAGTCQIRDDQLGWREVTYQNQETWH